MSLSAEAKRRSLFVRAASRAATQLAAGGPVTDATKARLVQGYRIGGDKFNFNPDRIDQSAIGGLKALGSNAQVGVDPMAALADQIRRRRIPTPRPDPAP